MLPAKITLAKTFQLIRSDMQFRCDYEHKKLNPLRVLSFMLNHAALSQVIYRLQMFFYGHHLGFFGGLLSGINSMLFTVNIDYRTSIGPRLLILHANYINIGKNVTLGEGCILAHQNSIAPAFTIDALGAGSDLGPTIGNGVLFGAGSVVTGNISIGDFSKIAINSAVDKSFAEYAVLFGVPARNTNKSKAAPATSQGVDEQLNPDASRASTTQVDTTDSAEGN